MLLANVSDDLKLIKLNLKNHNMVLQFLPVSQLTAIHGKVLKALHWQIQMESRSEPTKDPVASTTSGR